MSLPRHKIIIALIPFAITTIALAIFLLFFYWGTVTFIGDSPFTVVYNGEISSDQNGQVNIRTHAGNQTFIVHKDQYEDQNITKEVSWYSANPISLHFNYQAKISDPVPFTPSISYINPIAISDNQLDDLVMPITSRKLTLPSGINRVVWNSTGTKACLLHTGSGSTQNQLLDLTTNSSEPLAETVFDCQSGPKSLHTIGLQDSTLAIDQYTLSLPSTHDLNVVSSLYTNEAFITFSDDASKKTVLIDWDLDSNTHTEWHNITPTGALRVVGPKLIAIPTLKGVQICQNDTSILVLPGSVNLASILANAIGDTFYYIDIDHEPSFKNVFETQTIPHYLYQQHLNNEQAKQLLKLSDNQNILLSRLSPNDQEAWYLLDKPESSIMKVRIQS